MDGTENDLIMAYTDSSTPNNPGPSGFAAVLIHYDKNGQKVRKWSTYGQDGVDGPRSSNMRGKVRAAIEALRAIPEGYKGRIVVVSNTEYVSQCLVWLTKWAERGLDTRRNADLWTTLKGLIEGRNVVFQHMKSKRTGPFTTEARLRAQLAAPE